jgi:hypothetical protein
MVLMFSERIMTAVEKHTQQAFYEYVHKAVSSVDITLYAE